MGAQQKGIPLDIDYNEALTCRQEEGTPDLIITGKKKRDDDKGGGGGGDEEEDKEGVPMYVRRALKESENTFSSRQGSDQADEDKISCLTDDELNQTINKYTNHLRLNLKDKGEKIRTFLDKLKQEKETRRHQKNEVREECSLLPHCVVKHVFFIAFFFIVCKRLFHDAFKFICRLLLSIINNMFLSQCHNQ